MGKPTATYKLFAQLGKKYIYTTTLDTTLYDNLRGTYAIQIKVHPSAQELVTSILKLKCSLTSLLSTHNQPIFYEG